ncbi:TPA: hypothetical protein RPG34_003416 [Yersinia enterocolitica]|nr:hypothetical protein [Yersinia enterocolitica]
MDKHIEELGKPVAWTDAEELRDIERGYSGYLFKLNPADRNIDPRRQIMLYPQAYVDALLAKLEAAEKENGELAMSLNVANDATGIWKGRAKAAEARVEVVEASNNKNGEAFHKAVKYGARLETENLELKQRAEAAEARLLVPVKLPKTFWYEHDDLSADVPVMDRRLVIKGIKEAGFKVEGK